MSRYAALHNPAPVWSIFDYAAALFVEPVIEGMGMLSRFRSAGRKTAQRPTTALLVPQRPLQSWRRHRALAPHYG